MSEKIQEKANAVPKFKVGDVVRAEWDGFRSAFVKIETSTVFQNFIGYSTESDQHFVESELSSDIRVGDIVKSEFNGVVSLVTETGMENANVVQVDVANNGSFRLITNSEIEHLSEGEMQLMKDPLSFCIKKWVPKVGDEVIVTKELFSFDWYDESYDGRNYTVIMKIKEVREQENSVILEDYWNESIDNIKLYKEAK